MSQAPYRSRVGLLGLGHIGRLVAAHLDRFDVQVLATDPVASPDTARRAGVRLAPIEELFATCHVVSLHAPLLPETRGTIGARLLNSLGPGATLINTARGALIDETAAAQVLHARPDLTAVLDVTHPEPPNPDSPLFTLPNVVLTPHLGGALGAERHRLGHLCSTNSVGSPRACRSSTPSTPTGRRHWPDAAKTSGCR